MYTYTNYCEDLDYFAKVDDLGMLNEGFVNVLVGIKGKIGKFLLEAKNEFNKLVAEHGIELSTLLKAFKDKDFFAILSFFKYSLKACFKGITEAAKLLHGGLLKIFVNLHKDNALLERIKAGGADFDEYLSKHPILKRITGVAVAGMLLYFWLNMTFLGHLDYDMDISAMFKALKGTFSIEQLFLSPQGNLLLVLFLTGFASGGMISFVWLGGGLYNLILAITYVLFKRNDIETSITSKLRDRITKK